MKTRLITAAVASAMVIVLLIFRFTLALPVALAFVGCVAVFEIFRAARTQVNIPFFVLSLIFAAMMPFVARNYIPTSISSMYYIYFALFAACIVFRFEPRNLPDMFLTLVMVSYVTYGLATIEILIDWKFGMFYFLLAAFAAFVTDGGAYFVGSAVGKTQLSPEVSPKKTVEGAIGGLISSIIVSITFAYIYATMFCKEETVKLIPLIICVLIASAAGMIGDLFASAVKRTYGVKDYGKIMPGHGGIMDRCDSICVTLPVVMIFAQHFTLLG